MTGFIRKTIGSLTGATEAGEKAMQASRISADAQREALAYLKEREALPQQFREASLTQLGGLYGLEGGEGSQQMLIDQAQRSPLYEAMMGTRQAGEEAILRNAAATGGLRSGNVKGAMYDYNTQLQNQALLESYNQQLQGLTGLAQLPSNVNQIAGAMSGIGTTLAQGKVADAQAQQAGMGMALNTLSQPGVASGIGKAVSGLAGIFSDTRLKDGITPVGELNGHRVYVWVWNAAAEKLGLHGTSMGVLAQEVETYRPDVIGEREGYKTVDYAKLEA